MTDWKGSITLNLGEFRTLIFTRAEELVAGSVAEQNKKTDDAGNIVFLPADSPGLKVFKTLDERYKQVEKNLQELDTKFTVFAETIKSVLLITKDESKTGSELYEAYLKLPTAPGETAVLNHLQFKVEAGEKVTLSYLNTIPNAPAKSSVEYDKNVLNFLNSVSELLSEARKSGKELTADQAIAVRTAYTLIERGHPLPRPYTSLGAPGTRKHQTLLFVTDAGPDNIKITTSSLALLDGVTVHTEYIDRSESKDKSLVEAYRLPSHIDAAKVRLHVGTDAPCSCYIGRPVFEGLNYKGSFEEYARIYREKNQEIESKHPDFFFKANLLKTAHFWASACSAMFANGIVDCKIAIERMNETQAIEFMKAVRANVIRDPETQFLSAAFNLNTEFEDASGDRIKEPFAIAQLAIKIAKEGGFDKVTWDGAGTQVPSIPITTILPFEKLLALVHMAHEQGLITYISAGLTVNDLAHPVFAGVDGCGIGNDLHYLTTGQKVVTVGAFNPKKIQDVINARNDAELHVFGQGGKLLAKLDIKYFEGSLETDENDLRTQLYEALLRKDQDEVERIIHKVAAIENEIPALKGKLKYNRAFLTAYRLLAAKKSILHSIVARHKEKLQSLLDKNDAVGLRATIEDIKEQRQQESAFRLPSIQVESPELPASGLKAAFALDSGLEGRARRSPLKRTFLSELKDKIKHRYGEPFLHNVCLENLDLSKEDKSCLCDTDLHGVYIIGIEGLPEGMTEEQLIEKGAVIIKPKLKVPFDPTRSTLYTVQDLQQNDKVIYDWVQDRVAPGKQSTIQERVMIDLHDSQILAALRTYVANHHVVGIMGGHAMLRGDPMFTQIALLCRQLAKHQFMVVTGGGPGAMEAANLGAYFSVYEESDLLNAIAMLQVNNLPPEKKEYENYMVADEVLRKYSRPDAGFYSLGVPTFFYGHEPYNRFALRQAKFVSNAIREDILVNICNCGIIFTPGAAGTRTEIFQFAVPNAYAKETPDSFSKPMIFLGVYWLENGVFQSVANVAQKEDAAKNRPTGYSTKIYCVKESDQVLSIINDFKKTYFGDHFPIPPTKPSDDEAAPKRLVAQAAVNKYVTRSEMRIGVGSGSTVKYVIEHLSTLARQNNWHLTTVPASLATRDALIATKNLVVSSLLETPFVDVVFDGTDETDVVLNQIKGGGGALMQEKILAAGTNQFIIIADSRKESEYLGKREKVPVPIEVNTLAYKRVKAAIVKQYGIEVKLRKSGESHRGPYMTDNSNVILDAIFSKELLANPAALELWIRKIPGVLEIGLFTGMVSRAFFTSPDGTSVHERIRLFNINDANPRTGITAESQTSVLQKVLQAVAKTPNAVVEMDLDLAALSPYERTIRGVQKAGADYNIPEFADPQRHFKELPGYTIDAWNVWINSEELKEVVARYPDLPWEGKDKKFEFAPFGDEHATVWSSFHIRYWESGELVARDVPTAGLAQFEELIHQAGGKLVFLSGRWTEEQIKGTKVCLKKSGIPHERIHLLIGNPDHKFSDAENKIRFQQQVLTTYGTPVAFFDDRKSNLDALKKQVPSLITVAMAIPGYSSATDVTTAENAVATFELKESNVSEHPVSSLFESFQGGLESVGASSSFASFRAKKTKPRAVPSAGTQEDQVLAAPIPKDVGTIRVGTFNVENLFSRFEFKKTSKPDFGNQDLKRSLTEDAAKRITAQAIRKLNADVLALEEVEDIQTLNFFVDQYLADLGYEHRYLIEGNDPRGIDVALISRLPIVHLRSYKNDKNAAGQFIFSRDCLEVSVQDPASKKEFMLYINHFKSMAGGREETSPKRRAQCARVISILKDNHGPNLDQGKPFIVLGDFNDYVDKNNQNDSVWELVVGTGLVNPVEFLPEQEQWTHFYAKEREYHQLDFLLLSHSLQRGEQTPILVRAGQPLRATRVVEQRFSGVGQDRPKASDHCPLAYDIVL